MVFNDVFTVGMVDKANQMPDQRERKHSSSQRSYSRTSSRTESKIHATQAGASYNEYAEIIPGYPAEDSIDPTDRFPTSGPYGQEASRRQLAPNLARELHAERRRCMEEIAALKEKFLQDMQVNVFQVKSSQAGKARCKAFF